MTYPSEIVKINARFQSRLAALGPANPVKDISARLEVLDEWQRDTFHFYLGHPEHLPDADEIVRRHFFGDPVKHGNRPGVGVQGPSSPFWPGPKPA